MTQQFISENTKSEKAINTEQLTKIIEAIITGKYSWACVLFLRCYGYEPSHYLPYNTYNRILKQNSKLSNSTRQKSSEKTTSSNYAKATLNNNSSQHLENIKKPSQLKILDLQPNKLPAESFEQYLSTKKRRFSYDLLMNYQQILRNNYYQPSAATRHLGEKH